MNCPTCNQPCWPHCVIQTAPNAYERRPGCDLSVCRGCAQFGNRTRWEMVRISSDPHPPGGC